MEIEFKVTAAEGVVLTKFLAALLKANSLRNFTDRPAIVHGVLTKLEAELKKAGFCPR